MSKVIKFISNTKNPYGFQLQENKVSEKVGFVSKSNAGTVRTFKNNTANVTGRKVTFKHV